MDDGSPDSTAATVLPYLDDPRFRYHRLPEKTGLGAASNADDVYHAGHLASLVAEVRAAVARHRESFTFDTHAGDLIAFFREAIASHHT